MLVKLSEKIRGRQIVIIGLGNSMHGDDGLGPALIDMLKGRVEATLIDAEDVPENYLGMIESACPDDVLIVNAVEMGAEPGEVVVFEMDQINSWSKFTHNPTLGRLAKVLQTCTGAKIVLLGVQPVSTQFGAGLSQPVLRTIQNLCDWFQKV